MCKKFNFLIFKSFLILMLIISCGDIDSIHEDYLQGEQVYAGRLDTLKISCLLYTSPSPRDRTRSRMPSSA